MSIYGATKKNLSCVRILPAPAIALGGVCSGFKKQQHRMDKPIFAKLAIFSNLADSINKVYGDKKGRGNATHKMQQMRDL